MSDAIAGAVHTMRMLADGSWAVTLHFEPKDRIAVMTMMGATGTPIACARLADGYARPSNEPIAIPNTYRDLGPICREAIDLCSNYKFREYVRYVKRWDMPATEAMAKEFILLTCNVTSRKELDTAEGARELFIEHVRKPFTRWVRAARESGHAA